MKFQLLYAIENLCTLVTWLFVWIVNLLVPRKSSTIIESHLTDVTLVRLFICVNDCVVFKLFVGCKVLKANIAFGWIAMKIHVVIEGGLKSESLFTRVSGLKLQA